MEEFHDREEAHDGSSSWLSQLLALPSEAIAYAAGKWKARHTSEEMLASAQPMTLSASGVSRLKDSWLKLAGEQIMTDWTSNEIMLIERISAETAECNRNNVTRTEAYRGIYFHFPELHWALLAHLVSRNGGWNMTDLQGEWLPRLLADEQRRDLFLFLERANALIFQDAYPQLLLYQWSISQGRSLFHLLPAFGVSRFMMPVWRQFWKERNSALLTTALIVNEQHYIEGRVVQNDYFEKRVLHALFFEMQSLLQLNGVLFPYGSGVEETVDELRLAGLILENFGDVRERVEFGKRLYAVLFGIPQVGNGARSFAAAVRHTGSRSDYAPRLFEPLRRQPPPRFYEEKLLKGRLKPGAGGIYSPALETAWPDHPVEPAEPGDWFRSADEVIPYFRELPLPPLFEITNEYGLMLNKLELAVLAAGRRGVDNGS